MWIKQLVGAIWIEDGFGGTPDHRLLNGIGKVALVLIVKSFSPGQKSADSKVDAVGQFGFNIHPQRKFSEFAVLQNAGLVDVPTREKVR